MKYTPPFGKPIHMGHLKIWSKEGDPTNIPRLIFLPNTKTWFVIVHEKSVGENHIGGGRAYSILFDKEITGAKFSWNTEIDFIPIKTYPRMIMEIVKWFVYLWFRIKTKKS